MMMMINVFSVGNGNYLAGTVRYFFLAHPNVVSTEFCSWVFAFNLGNVIVNKYEFLLKYN